MPRVQKVIARGGLKGPSTETSRGHPPREIADTVLLKFDDRCRQQGFVFGGKGTCIAFDFPESPRLRTDDLLLLDDGRLAEVVADIEPVLEVRTKDFAPLARLLVALGNRHVPVQVLANRIRLQKRPDVEALVAEHGLKGMEMAAPFEPEHDGGSGHDHEHHRGHGHDHEHHHHHHDGHGEHRHHDEKERSPGVDVGRSGD